MITSEKGIELIKSFESLHDGDLHKIGLQPKMCPAGYWTEGYGALVLTPEGKPLKGIANKNLAEKYCKIHTIAQAEKALHTDIVSRETMINSLRLKLTQGQFDALISFCYNIGFANLKASTLLRKIRVNPQDKTIRDEFAKWVKSGSTILQGLVKRRKAEADLYFG